MGSEAKEKRLTRFTQLMATAVTVVGLSGPGFAGGLQTAPVEPIVESAGPIASYGGDWTGGYAGLGFGNLNVDATGAADGDDVSYGVHAGYDHDFGQFVLGGEIEYDATDLDLGGAATVDSVARLKLRGGYDAGRTMLYVTGGVAEVDSSIGSETGRFGGVGLTYQVNDRFYVGGELLGHRFENIGGSGVDADATSLSVRGGVRF